MLQLTETTPELLTHFFTTYHEYGISAVHHLIAATLLSLAPPPDYTLCPQTATTLPQQLQHLFNFLVSPNITHTLSCAQVPATLTALAFHHPQRGHLLFSAANPPTPYNPLDCPDLSDYNLPYPLSTAPAPLLDTFAWNLLYSYTPNIKTHSNSPTPAPEQKWVHHTTTSTYLCLAWTQTHALLSPSASSPPLMPPLLSATLYDLPTLLPTATPAPVLFVDRYHYTETSLCLDLPTLHKLLPNVPELLTIPHTCFPLQCNIHLDINHEYLTDNPLSLAFVCHTANAPSYTFALRSRISILPEHPRAPLDLSHETHRTLLNRLQYFILALHQLCTLQQWLQPLNITLQPSPSNSPSQPRWHLQSNTNHQDHIQHYVKWDPSSHHLTSPFCDPILPHHSLAPLLNPLITIAHSIQLETLTC